MAGTAGEVMAFLSAEVVAGQGSDLGRYHPFFGRFFFASPSSGTLVSIPVAMQQSYGGSGQTTSGSAASIQGAPQGAGSGPAGAPGIAHAKSLPANGKPSFIKPPVPVALALGDFSMTLQGGKWSGGPMSGGSSEDDVAEIRRLRSEVDDLRAQLRAADEEKALVDFKNKLLVEMVRR